MNPLFHSTPLGVSSWLRIGAVAPLPLCFLVVELEKHLCFGHRPVTAVSA